ncbi:hypothetical protein FQN54_003850 [Arachnomyces sp. PD_36]|nr:hypothetical protein FQN54_003850 [Arachnomyces sp. PD_36]
MPEHPNIDAIRREVDEYIGKFSERLRAVNKSLHDNPELGFNEHHAHDTICDFLEKEVEGLQVTRHAYGLETAFEARAGNKSDSGRCINFNLEYDALPGIGHACGHNLIATAGLTGFVALSFAMKRFNIPGSTQLLGTPAEEGGGGKILLIEKGAYEGVDVSLMIHPMSENSYVGRGVTGSAGSSSTARLGLTCEYRGRSAHAAVNPWDGVNALDAIVLTYNNVSALRQQIRPDERIHGCILEAPKINNVIPEYTKIMYTVRSPTLAAVRALGDRVKRCIEAGGHATGCEVNIDIDERHYADLRPNEPLCGMYQTHMSRYGDQILKMQPEAISASTDMGNVSYIVPGLHALIGIATEPGANPHMSNFTPATGSQEAHERIERAGKAMALTGWELLVSQEAYDRVREDFERDKKSRP